MGETMPFEARALVPLRDHPQAAHPAFDDAAEPGLTFFDVADDSLPTEGLATALVLENVHHARDRTATFTLLSTELLPALARAVTCVLVAGGSPPHGVPGTWVRRSRGDFSLPLTAARQALDHIGLPLSRRAPERVTVLAARPGVLAAIRAARPSARPRALASVLERARGEEDLLTELAGVLLAGTSGDSRRALGLALRVEHSHPAMTSAVTGESLLAQGPWIQSLEDGWSRVRNNWRDRLRAALGQRSMPTRQTLRKTADRLLQAGEGDEAISAYFMLGDHDYAAREK